MKRSKCLVEIPQVLKVDDAEIPLTLHIRMRKQFPENSFKKQLISSEKKTKSVQKQSDSLTLESPQSSTRCQLKLESQQLERLQERQSTFQLNENIKLCDCPGLVFPSFSHNRADFVLNGVLPVDKERDYVGYLSLLCSRIPARVFNNMYQLNISQDVKWETGVGMHYGTQKVEGEYFCTYMQLLLEFESKRGMERGIVGRKIVKDLFRGKLLWIANPPISKKKITKMSDQDYAEMKKMKNMEEQLYQEQIDGEVQIEEGKEFEEADDLEVE